MASAFDDVELTWAGRTYRIPARNMMGAIARIEDHVTMVELQRYGEKQTAPLAKICSAYASLLRFAGCSGVKDEDVYAGMFGEDGAQQEMITIAVTTVLGMMVPRSAQKPIQSVEGAAVPGKPTPTVARTSKKRTSSRSAKNGSPRVSSGS